MKMWFSQVEEEDYLLLLGFASKRNKLTWEQYSFFYDLLKLFNGCLSNMYLGFDVDLDNDYTQTFTGDLFCGFKYTLVIDLYGSEGYVCVLGEDTDDILVEDDFNLPLTNWSTFIKIKDLYHGKS